MGNYCALAFQSMSMTVLIPLMWSTSIPTGGLGFSPYEIGVVLSIWGIFNALLPVVFLGALLRRFGERRVFISSMIAVFLGTCAFAFQSFVARSSNRVNGMVWTLVCLQLIFNIGISVGYGMYCQPSRIVRISRSFHLGSVQILIVQSATSRLLLGATNGLAQMAGSAARGLAPALTSSLFSMTLEYHLAGDFLVYIVISSIALLAAAISFRIPKHIKQVES